MVLGKDDRFTDFLTIVDADAFRHQNVQHFPNSILVEDVFVQCGRIDALGEHTVFIGKGLFISFAILIRQFVIMNAFIKELHFALDRHKINKITVRNSLRQLITISRITIGQVENTICVLIDFILGCSGKANQRRVEIIEDVLILVVDRAMCLITNHEVKVARREDFTVIILG